MGRIEVKSNGIVIGHTYDEGKTINFLDNGEAKNVLDKMNTGTPIGISSRKMGNIDADNNIIYMGDINEFSIIDGGN